MKTLVDIISERKYKEEGDKWWQSENRFAEDMHNLMDALFEDRLTLDLDGEKYKLSIEGERKNVYIKAEKQNN